MEAKFGNTVRYYNPDGQLLTESWHAFSDDAVHALRQEEMRKRNPYFDWAAFLHGGDFRGDDEELRRYRGDVREGDSEEPTTIDALLQAAMQFDFQQARQPVPTTCVTGNSTADQEAAMRRAKLAGSQRSQWRLSR